METSLIYPKIGKQLRERRENKQLTLDDVASQLRLKKDLIDDIEKGIYSKIPLIYLKCYLRSYAKLLAIPETQVLLGSELSRQPNPINGWKFFCSHKQVSSGDKHIQWITYMIISILVLLVTLWWEDDSLAYKNLGVNDPMPDQMIWQAAKNPIIDKTK